MPAIAGVRVVTGSRHGLGDFLTLFETIGKYAGRGRQPHEA